MNFALLLLNFCMPIVVACFVQKFEVHTILFLVFCLLQLITVFVLMFALEMIKNQVDEQG